MKSYLEYSIWDWLLCTVTASGFIINFYNGYYMTDRLSKSLVAVLLLTGVIQGAIMLFNRNRRTRLAGAAAGAAAVAVAVAYNQMVHPFLHEKMFSSGVFWILLLVLNVVVFFMLRRRITVLILIGAGNLIIAAEVFLLFGLDLPGYVMFLMGSVAMLFWRTYIEGLTEAVTARMQTKRYVAQAGAVCGAAMMTALLIFALILGPLHLKTHELKIIEELQSMEVVHKVGTTTILPEPDASMTSDNKEKGRTTSSRDPDKIRKKGNGDEKSSSDDRKKGDNKKLKSDKDKKNNSNDDREKKALAVKYSLLNLWPVVIPLLMLAAVIISVIIRKRQRQRFLIDLENMERKEGIIRFYGYFSRVFRMLKIVKPETMTLKEFAGASRKHTSPFVSGDHDFGDMTLTYAEVIYGGREVTEEDWTMFTDAYYELHDNIYDEVGKWRYITLFYRI